MRKRKFIALLTILVTFPNLLLTIVLIGRSHFPLTHWLILEKISIIVFGIIGGVMLWNGKRMGHILCLIAWMIVFEASSSSLYQFYFGIGHSKINDFLKQIWGYRTLLGIIAAVPIVAILIWDLITAPRPIK